MFQVSYNLLPLATSNSIKLFDKSFLTMNQNQDCLFSLHANYVMKQFLFFIIFTIVLSSVFAQKKYTLPTAPNIKELKFLGEYDVPFNMKFKGTTIGGLSGIDYDEEHNQYYTISDDRSEHNPARFYTLKIAITPKGIDTVIFTNYTSLLQSDGTVYPNKDENPYKTPDPEALRYNPNTKQMVWTSEGEREVGLFKTILENPAITTINTNGKYIDTFPLPNQVLMHKEEFGPRKNSVFEGVAFTNEYKEAYVSIEEPLYQDGERADTQEVNAMVRILRFDLATKKNTAQFAYKLEPIAHSAIPMGFKINGISDILGVAPDKLLVMERSFSTGRMACTIKIFEADFSKATNIKDYKSLLENKDFVPAKKRLIINMDNLKRYVDNVEGMTFGPTLPNGHKTLITIVDNNFNIFETTQIFLFEVIEK